MVVRRSDFCAFVDAMAGLRLLHVGHRDADCDALGSAYAMSRVLPGDVGFAQGLKTSARDLAAWLGLSPIIDPDLSAYDYAILYDVNSPGMLGAPLPDRYALFDHHVPGGHRYASLRSELASGAEWCWVEPLESTCSVLVEQFMAHGIALDRRMSVALAAGIVTDTGWLELANAGALRRLAAVLDPAGLYLEDVLAAIDGPDRRAARRSAVVAALRGVRERRVGAWSILVAQTGSHDHGFAVTAALQRVGGDVCVVAFPKDGRAMVMAECGIRLVERTGMDLGAVMAGVAGASGAAETWGSALFGRVIGDAGEERLLAACVAAIERALQGAA
ncbi:MAG: DHH family phosphoesterase [Anaerolineae bacterium]|nr:DHH family phosphoesterase [Anaerolineae bacterium]